jgi:signal transduction histidine kinase
MLPSMKPGLRRALVGVVSVGAILVPAVGIAYLGAVSYQADRGFVAAKVAEYRATAQSTADALERELTAALAAAAAAAQEPEPGEALAALAARDPVAAQPFLVGADGELVHPREDPLSRPRDSAPDAEFLALLGARAAEPRARRLAQARGLEHGGCAAALPGCVPSEARAAEALRLYRDLARHDDSGPAALLGLARLHRRAGRRAEALAALRELDARFAERTDDGGVGYGLLADLGIAELEGTAAAYLALYRGLIERGYVAPSLALTFTAERARRALSMLTMSAAERAELEKLDRALAQAREVSLSGELDQLVRAATDEPRGRAAHGSARRTLLYQRLSNGAVVGLGLDRRAIGAAAARVAAALPTHAAVRIEGVRERPDEREFRILGEARFGPLLPHLGLYLVEDRALPDPLDDIVRDRGRRHLAITSGLALVLVLGLIATMRGAFRARELARLKSDFVSTVSHELKTPLTSIRMFAEMLREGVAAGDRDREGRYHEIIVKESERLGLLIANLLDYAQIERGTRRYSPQREPLDQLAAEAIAAFHRLREGGAAEIRLAVAPAADGHGCVVDREVTIQALLNLLSNAAKYGGEQPIEVAVTRSGDELGVAVKDAGPGIPRAEQGRIFREFYRAPAAYSSGVEGTGLGLALVKRHVEAQGGRVELVSELGQGATFTVWFPIAQPPPAEAA